MSGWSANAVGGEDGCPAVLFHGTKREHLPSIRANGLIPRQPRFWPDVNGQPSEPEAVYLTDGLGQAVANCEGTELIGRVSERDVRRVVLACLLAVDVTGLPLLRLGFYTCMQPIPPERITSITEHPALRRQLREETGW